MDILDTIKKKQSFKNSATIFSARYFAISATDSYLLTTQDI